MGSVLGEWRGEEARQYVSVGECGAGPFRREGEGQDEGPGTLLGVMLCLPPEALHVNGAVYASLPPPSVSVQ